MLKGLSLKSIHKQLSYSSFCETDVSICSHCCSSEVNLGDALPHKNWNIVFI